MNKMTVFQNTEFGELGVLEINGKPYFPATECARILGYANPKKAIIDHCKGVTKRDLLTNGGIQIVNFIPEGDLYRLIVSSKLPAAERFETWVFDEVLPAIRKTGAYSVTPFKPKATSVGEIVKLIDTAKASMERQGCSTHEIAATVKQICDQFGIVLPDFFVKPESFTLRDAIDMVDFVYAHPRGRGKRKPTYEEYLEYRYTRRLPERNTP